MSYEKIRNNTIPKYAFGNTLNVLEGTFEDRIKKKQLRQQQIQALGIDPEDADLFSDEELNQMILNPNSEDAPTVSLQEGIDFGSSAADKKNADAYQTNAKLSDFDQKKALGITNGVFGALGFNAVDAKQQYDKDGNPTGMSEAGQMALGITSQAVSKGVQAVDNAIMGDKNFSASSQAIDSAVHGVSGALMKSGNPYAMAAGAALEGLNFVTKAGGKNVPGYDVNINNSGYGTIGHQESEAGRIWDNWSGATAKKLAKRNEQARMALAAADISEDQAFEQEARSNSITNVLQQNQIALAGGIDTSLLGS